MNPFENFDIIGNVADSTSGYIANFAPIFVFMAGLILAMGIITWIISLLTGRDRDPGIDDTMRL